MQNVIKSTLILAMVALTTSLILSHLYKITYPSIIKQEKQKEKDAISIVLKGYSIIEKKSALINGKKFVYQIGEKKKNNNILKGYAFIGEKNGYSGLIKTMIGIDEDGKILGISILQQSETPGLGARSIEIASKLTFFGFLFGTTSIEKEPLTPWFQEQFKEIDTKGEIKILKKGDWKPEFKEELLQKNAISAITGATITTKTVRDSIKIGLNRFILAQQQLNINGKEKE